MKSTGRGGTIFRPCLLCVAVLLTAACPGPLPTTPQKPLGPDSLAVGEPGRFRFYSLPAEPERDRYVIDWSRGRVDTTAAFRAGDTLTLERSWPDTGRFGVRCMALRDDGRASDWSEIHPVVVYNRAPVVIALFAPETARAGVPALCGAVAVDPEGDRLVYRFDWGDGSVTVTERYASADTCRQYHTWAEPGSPAVRVLARDDRGNESPWSPARTVTVLP